MMIHFIYTFIMVQSFVGQLFSDYNNFIDSSLSSFWTKSFSSEDRNNNSTCSPILSSITWGNPILIIGLTCLIVGLLMGLVIILIKKLHTPSTRNYVVIFIAIIIMIPGIASLSLFDKWYYSVISEAVAFVTTVLAIITGMKLKIISVKWRKVLFAIACLFTITEIIFTIVGIIFKTDDRLRIVFQILSCATWCCTVFIVVSSTVWYLISHYDGIRYSMLFCAVCAWYEFALADINLQFVFIVSGCTKETNAFKL